MVEVKIDKSLLRGDSINFDETAEYRIAAEGEYYISVYGDMQVCKTMASTVPVLVLKPLRWRAEKGTIYYSIHFFGSGEPYVLDTTELNDDEDNYKYSMGNYFRTEEEAEERLRALEPLLLNFFRGENEK